MDTLDYPLPLRRPRPHRDDRRADHIRDLIEQVLFTSPGERVMRPDFGGGLLALVFEPNSATLAATTQFLVQERAAAALGAPDRGRGGRASRTIDATLQVTVRLRRAATTAASQQADASPCRRAAARMRYFCCDAAPARGAASCSGTRQRHRVPRGARPPRAGPGAAPAHAVRAPAAARLRARRADNVRIDGGERVAIGAGRVGRAGRRPAAGHRPRAGRRHRRPARARWWSAPQRVGDFSRYTLHLRRRPRAATSRRPASTRCCRSIEFSFKVECPSDFDCAARTPCPPEPVEPPEIDYLAKDYPASAG